VCFVSCQRIMQTTKNQHTTTVKHIKLLSIISFALLFSVLTAATGVAQDTGKIAGTIVDAETGETLIGATVQIPGTSRGASTDIDGKYSITNLEPGTYDLKVTYISYAPKNITGVRVKAGETTTINVSMKSASVNLDEVTVTAQANTSGEAGLLSIQRKAVPVQDGLSAEIIKKNNDSNVASAMKRVTGVTLMGDNDVYVRGLGNRYSNVQLNGSAVPSTDPNKKEAPVDILTSNIVENIVVQKTYTPDQSGEFSGGSVQIVTKEFPDDEMLGFSYSTSVNTVAGFGNYLGYSGGSTDLLGYDDGFRSIPSAVKDGRLTPSNKAAAVKELNNTWMPENTYQAIPSQKFSVNYARQFNEDKSPIGLVTSFSYKFNNKVRSDETYRYINNYNVNTDQASVGADYVSNTGIQETHLSGMVNLFWKPSSSFKIGLKNLYSNSSTDEAKIITGSYYNYDGTNRQTVIGFDRKSIYSSTLNSEAYFANFYESKLEVNLTYAQALRNQPDRRNTQYITNDQGEYEILFSDYGNTHFFSDQLDQNYNAKLDYEIKPFKKIGFKAGGEFMRKNRDFEARKLVYLDLSNSYPNQYKTLSPEEAMADERIISGDLNLAERTSPNDSYTGEQNLYAGYLSTSIRSIKNLTIEGGIRFEQSAQYVNNELLVDEGDILPAVNLTYNLGRFTNIRAAYSNTLARPEFRELSDFNFRDFIGGRTVYGNPDLERTVIDNYDLRFEHFMNPGEMFAVSVFYKDFTNPIEIWNRLTQNYEVFYNNAPGATLYGVEIEGRKNITENLKVNANLSLIKSQVDYGNEAKGRQANLERSMYGQSPYTLNVGLYYTMPSTGINMNLAYNTFGKRISTVGSSFQPDDEYEMPFHSLNLSLSKKFKQLSLSMDVENLLNDKVTYKQGGVVTNEYAIGQTFSVGLSYAF
jgi:outer membrane receptor protein involved in Fe transport